MTPSLLHFQSDQGLSSRKKIKGGKRGGKEQGRHAWWKREKEEGRKKEGGRGERERGEEGYTSIPCIFLPVRNSVDL